MNTKVLVSGLPPEVLDHRTQRSLVRIPLDAGLLQHIAGNQFPAARATALEYGADPVNLVSFVALMQVIGRQTSRKAVIDFTMEFVERNAHIQRFGLHIGKSALAERIGRKKYGYRDGHAIQMIAAGFLMTEREFERFTHLETYRKQMNLVRRVLLKHGRLTKTSGRKHDIYILKEL